MTAEIIRKKLRIVTENETVTNDIQDNMDACLLDLKRVGIDTTQENKLLDKAIELYCKAQYNFADRGEAFTKSYEELRNAMSLCRIYMESEDE